MFSPVEDGYLLSEMLVEQTSESTARPNVLEQGGALALLLAAAPLLAVLYVLHRLTCGADVPFLYGGERIGFQGRLFTIYKIRSLVPAAEQQLEGRLHDDNARLELPLGRFLRRTRLDELPQLWNVARGEMAFVGPRPERPSVYARQCRSIPGYQHRFAVRPGLTGLAQFFTPHGAPKRLRARIDNLLVRRAQRWEWRCLMVVQTALAVLRNVACELVRPLTRRMALSWVSVSVDFCPPAAPEGRCVAGARIRRLDRHHLLVHTRKPIRDREPVHIRLSRVRGGRRRHVHCHGVPRCLAAHPRGGYAYDVRYEPVSPRHAYLLGRHILRDTVA